MKANKKGPGRWQIKRGSKFQELNDFYSEIRKFSAWLGNTFKSQNRVWMTHKIKEFIYVWLILVIVQQTRPHPSNPKMVDGQGARADENLEEIRSRQTFRSGPTSQALWAPKGGKGHLGEDGSRLRFFGEDNGGRVPSQPAVEQGDKENGARGVPHSDRVRCLEGSDPDAQLWRVRARILLDHRWLGVQVRSDHAFWRRLPSWGYGRRKQDSDHEIRDQNSMHGCYQILWKQER